jgi:hypothetical protein
MVSYHFLRPSDTSSIIGDAGECFWDVQSEPAAELQQSDQEHMPVTSQRPSPGHLTLPELMADTYMTGEGADNLTGAQEAPANHLETGFALLICQTL